MPERGMHVFRNSGNAPTIINVRLAKTTAGESRVVFISWAHRDSSMTDKDANSWLACIRALVEKLTDMSIKVRNDLYEPSSTDWSRYGPQMIQECHFTLIATSKAWRERWEGRNEPHEGAGAAREADTLHGMFDENQQEFRFRTVIVMLPGTTEESLPTDLRHIPRFVVDPHMSESMEPLVRHILDKPKYVLPKLGAQPDLPPEGRVTHETPTSGPSVPPRSEVEYDENSTEFNRALEKAVPPPEFQPDRGIEAWFTELAAWNDNTATLIDDIELAAVLTSRDQSARFVQQINRARESIAEIISGLRGPRTAEHEAKMSETAARLRGQVVRLTQLALKP
jgi:hypothetical protein